MKRKDKKKKNAACWGGESSGYFAENQRAGRARHEAPCGLSVDLPFWVLGDEGTGVALRLGDQFLFGRGQAAVFIV